MGKCIEIHIETVDNIRFESEGTDMDLITTFQRTSEDRFMVQYTTNTEGVYMCPHCMNFFETEEDACNCCEDPTFYTEEEMCVELENNLQIPDVNIYINHELLREGVKED